MIAAPDLERLNEQQVRELAAQLLVEVRHKQAAIDKLTHEMAVLKRLRFAARSEQFSVEQRSLLEEDTESDLQALAKELEQLAPAAGRGDGGTLDDLPAAGSAWLAQGSATPASPEGQRRSTDGAKKNCAARYAARSNARLSVPAGCG